MNERTEAGTGDLFPDAPIPKARPRAPRRPSILKGKRDLTASDRREIWNAAVMGGLGERGIARALGIARSAVRSVLADGGP